MTDSRNLEPQIEGELLALRVAVRFVVLGSHAAGPEIATHLEEVRTGKFDPLATKMIKSAGNRRAFLDAYCRTLDDFIR